jgi:hypothetical protein
MALTADFVVEMRPIISRLNGYLAQFDQDS